VDHGSMHQLMTAMGGGMMDGGVMGGFMWFWAIFMVVVLALLVAGAIWLARTLTRPSSLQAGQQGRTRREPSWISAMPAAT
jgi:predicted lipid-binding transport protein (Tim44 family)